MKNSHSRFLQKLAKNNEQFSLKLPSRDESGRFLHNLLSFLFPISQDCKNHPTENDLERSFQEIVAHFECLLYPLQSQLQYSTEELTDLFFKDLEAVYEELLLDAQTINNNDPASVGVEEVIGVYPGFIAIAIYRIAHILVAYQVPFLPRIFTEYAHSKTGIDIHPNAVIGSSFFIDHGTGIVIGETTHIGNNVKIYQGVTLGATHVTKSLASQKRHPTIEDNVVIYANATILGGNTVIGHDSIIGGNAWITKSTPPFSQVYHQSQTQIRPTVASND